MTLIELFDQQHMENIVACLRLKPEQVIFLGEQEQIQPFLERYGRLLRSKGLKTKVQPRDVDLGSVEDIAKALLDIIESRGRCVIDLTGGDERLTMGVGAVLGRLSPQQREQVEVQRFVLPDGKAEDYDGDGQVLPGEEAALTADELIVLHGGTIFPRSAQPAMKYTPKDIEVLWEIVKDDPRQWNRLISLLRELEKPCDTERTEFYIRREVAKFPEKWEELEPFLQKLQTRRIITSTGRGEGMRYRYTDPLLQYCLLKEGNLLEVKTLLEARALLGKGRPFFDDCRMSVNIDWDGKTSQSPRQFSGTHNEIDVILTRGMKALFISCKNGDVGDAELYKLCTVAERFGSPYARKMLIVTELEKEGGRPEEALTRRARDMGVYLVKHAAKLHKDGWEYIFKEAMK